MKYQRFIFHYDTRLNIEFLFFRHITICQGNLPYYKPRHGYCEVNAITSNNAHDVL